MHGLRRVQTSQGDARQAATAGVGNVHHVAGRTVGVQVVGEPTGLWVLHGEDEVESATAQVELPRHVGAVDEGRVAIGVGVGQHPVAAIEVAVGGEHVPADPAAKRRGRRGLARDGEGPGHAIEPESVCWVADRAVRVHLPEQPFDASALGIGVLLQPRREIGQRRAGRHRGPA